MVFARLEQRALLSFAKSLRRPQHRSLGEPSTGRLCCALTRGVPAARRAAIVNLVGNCEHCSQSGLR